MIHLLLALIYISFISLGLPDGLLGAAWPTMYPEFGVPVSYAGGISLIICAGTVVSSLASDWLTRKLGAGKVTAISVAMTAAALFGFAYGGEYWVLCLWAIPYGLGAGSVDASLNNYVAIHYASRHMSWLHCMWGVGASVGPYIIGAVLTGGGHWSLGYLLVGIAQVVLTAVLFLSLPIWKGNKAAEGGDPQPVGLVNAMKIPGAWEVMVMFFCYCALEQTAALWSGSYLVLHNGMSEEAAASFSSLFYLGMTVGRAISGFVTMKFSDTKMIRLGLAIVAVGIVVLLLPFGIPTALTGFILIGLGCAPVYPCVIHATPHHFGADKSQALIGIEMASAYVGTALMPPLFGILAENFGAGLMGFYLLALLALMTLMHERLITKCERV